VVRLPVTAQTFTGSGSGLTNIPIAGVSGLTDALDGKLGTNAPAFLGAVAHTNRSDNPHAVTPAQIGAVSNTPAGIAAAGGQLAETVVTGAVVTVTSGNRYMWVSATNVNLTCSLTAGQVCNYASIRNSATNSITATGVPGWAWFTGNGTNTIAAGKVTVFGFSVSAESGQTNGFAITQSN
jgi:hypothetical protein